MSNPITKLKLSKFRGASQPFEIDFDPSKNMTLLFGENGPGKSTLIDAVDAVCNGNVGSIASVSTGARSSTNFIPTIGSDVSEVEAYLFSGDEHWGISVSRSRIQPTGSAGKPEVAILRRDRILDLIIAPPAERYKALQKFIDVDGVQKAENSLKSAFDEAVRTINESVKAQSDYEEKLETLWGEEGHPDESAKQWASEIVGNDVEEITKQKDGHQKVVRSIDALIVVKGTYDKATDELKISRESLGEIKKIINSQPSVDAKQAIRLVDALSKTKEYVESAEKLESCPVCLQPVGRDELFATVTSELKGMEVLKNLNDRLKAAERAFGIKESAAHESSKALQEAAKLLSNASSVISIDAIEEKRLTWPEWADTVADIDDAAIIVICETVLGVRDELNAAADELVKQVNQYNSLKLWVGGIEDEKAAGVNATRLRNGLEKALGLVREKRISFTQSVLDDISGEADRLYQCIHPGESIGLSRLEMDPRRRGSVNQTGNFHGYDEVPPQALLSESHMDTLGFCVWLALVKKETPADTIVIIDDVFTSVDSVHLTRIVDLLADECSGFKQVIATTHFRNWWQRYLGGAAPGRNTELIELGRWTIESGIRMKRPPLALDGLVKSLGADFPDREKIASSAGILLERTFDQITEQFGCRVARNSRNEYTLGVLLNGSSRLFRESLRIKLNINWKDDDAEATWEEMGLVAEHSAVKDSVFVRNQVGCHFSVQGMDIADVDVIRFGELTLALVKPLICPKCGMIPRRPLRDGTGYRCQCNNLELRPVSA